jgi:hypothetical protein
MKQVKKITPSSWCFDGVIPCSAALRKKREQVAICLIPRANRACQAAVIGPVILVPKRLAPANTVGQHFELFARAGGRLSGLEIIVIGFRGEILIVAVLEDRLKNIFEGWIGHDNVNSLTGMGLDR